MCRAMLSLASVTALVYQAYAGCYVPTGQTECATINTTKTWTIQCNGGDYTVTGKIEESKYQNPARDAKSGETGVDAAYIKYCIYKAAGNDCNGNPVSKTFQDNPVSTCSPSGKTCPTSG